MMMRWIKSLSLTLIGVGFLSCGSGDNSIRIISQGFVRETNIQSMECHVQLSGGGPSPLFAPLVCTMLFRTDGLFSDIFQFTVSDVALAYQQMGQAQLIPGGLITGSVTINQSEVSFSGVIRFTNITNTVGGKVSGDFQLQSAFDTIEGKFSTRVNSGF